VELRTGVHANVAGAVTELAAARPARDVLSSLGLAAGVAGTHPSAVWHDMVVSSRERHQEVYGSMRAHIPILLRASSRPPPRMFRAR